MYRSKSNVLSAVVVGPIKEFREVAAILGEKEKGTQPYNVAKDLLHHCRDGDENETRTIVLSISGAELVLKTMEELVGSRNGKPKSLPDHLDTFCPICDEEITVSIVWETETGEDGTVLSKYPVVNPDPETIDRHGHCNCDHSKPVSEAFADYLSGERLENLLFAIFPNVEPVETTKVGL